MEGMLTCGRDRLDTVPGHLTMPFCGGWGRVVRARTGLGLLPVRRLGRAGVVQRITALAGRRRQREKSYNIAYN